MKRKRKPKHFYNFPIGNIVIEMTWHGFSRGIAFGAIYGVLVLMGLSNSTESYMLLISLPLALMFGLPFGAVFGMIAGLALGIVNGFLIGVLNRLFFVYWKDVHFYRSAVRIAVAFTTLSCGTFIFQKLNLSLAPYSFFVFAVVPALIAAIVFGQASGPLMVIWIWYAAQNDKSTQVLALPN